MKNGGALRVGGLQSPVGCKEAVVRRVGVHCRVCSVRTEERLGVHVGVRRLWR